MADIVGINQHTDPAGPQNTLEDFGTSFRANYRHEGIIEGMRIVANSPVAPNVKVSPGYCAIETGDGEFFIFRLKTEEVVALPNTGASKYYLIVAVVDVTNATEDIIAVEGTAGTDPNLVEGGSPEVYYLVLGRVEATAVNISNSEIKQDGSTLTNNSTPEIIGRVASNASLWQAVEYPLTRSTDTKFTVPGNVTKIFRQGTRVKFTNSGTKIFVVFASSVSNNVTTVEVVQRAGVIIDVAAITDVYISYDDRPDGYPLIFTFTPTYTGFSVDPPAQALNQYTVDPSGLITQYHNSVNNVGTPVTGTSNSADFLVSSPVPSLSPYGSQTNAFAHVMNNGVSEIGSVKYEVFPLIGFIRVLRNTLSPTFTASGSKGASFIFQYRI